MPVVPPPSNLNINSEFISQSPFIIFIILTRPLLIHNFITIFSIADDIQISTLYIPTHFFREKGKNSGRNTIRHCTRSVA